MSLFKPLLNKELQKVISEDAQIPDLNRDSMNEEDRKNLERYEKLLSLGFIELKEWGTRKEGDTIVLGKMAGLSQTGVDYLILGDLLYRLYRYSQLLSLPLAVLAVIISFISLLK